MADQDPDHTDRADRERPEDKGVPFDEEAAWAAIVAQYGEEPPDPPGARPFKSVEDLARLEAVAEDTGDTEDEDGGDRRGTDGDTLTKDPDGDRAGDGPAAVRPLGSSVSFAPGVGGAGPRDYSVAEPSDGDFGEDDEGHFVPPEPPPLPEADATAKFAWLGVVGGPVLLLVAILLGWDMSWWLTTVCVGGFLGGCLTLLMRMDPGDEDDDEPGRGAVV